MVFTFANPNGPRRAGHRPRSWLPRALLLAALVGLGLAPLARATNLLELRYEPRTDALLATIAFRGTHRHHDFSVTWGECRESLKEPTQKEIGGLIVDAHGSDFAREDYVVVARFDLSGLPCRPARITLRTSTGATRTVDVSAVRG